MISELSEEELYRAPETENQVYYLFRHNVELAQQTKGLFKAEGGQRYYLDICDGNQLKKEDITYLFKRIFDNQNVSIPQIDEIYKFCCEIAHSMDVYLFEPREHIFSRPEYDEVIREALLSS